MKLVTNANGFLAAVQELGLVGVAIPASYPVVIAEVDNEYIYEKSFVPGAFVWRALINGLDYLIEDTGDGRWRVLSTGDLKGQLIEVTNARQVPL